MDNSNRQKQRGVGGSRYSRLKILGKLLLFPVLFPLLLQLHLLFSLHLHHTNTKNEAAVKFCGSNKWLKSHFSCEERAQFLVSRYHVPEQNAKSSLLGSGCQCKARATTNVIEVLGEQPFTNTTCTCVDCEEDKVCGGLWRGSRYPGMSSDEDEEVLQKKLHLVVSHCKRSLSWMQDYIEGFTNVASIHVISKCGHEVEGAPIGAEILVLPNVGRCDHTYANFITTILPTLTTPKDDNSIVLFLKDTSVDEFSAFGRTDPKSLVRIASSSNGFACGTNFGTRKRSPYHDRAALFDFKLESYRKETTADEAPFRVGNQNLGDFYNSLNARPSSPDLVQVCYYGIFAASTENIFKQDMRVWKTIEKALERGDNIVEGHFMERLWGVLLATPLEAFQVEALRNHSAKVLINPRIGLHGPLCKKKC